MSADARGGLAPASLGFARGPLVRAALVLLALLYSSAIYAPLIANDHPYRLESIDVRGYTAAKREVAPLARSLIELAAESPEVWLARRMPGSTMTHGEAVRGEAHALLLRLDLLGRHTPERAREVIDNCRRALEGALAGSLDPLESAPGAAAASLEIVRDEASRIQRTLSDVDPGRPLEARAALVAATSWPLFASLTGPEIFLMIAWPFVLAAALVARRGERRRRAAIVLGTGLVLGLAGSALGGGRAFATAPYRQAIERGDLLVEGVVFAPIAFGFAETDLGAAYAPPGWSHPKQAADAAGDVPDAAGSTETGRTLSGTSAPGATSATSEADALRTTDAIEAPIAARPRAATTPRHWLGTDSLGRDLLARLVWGGRVSLSVGLVSALLLTLIGTALGALAGYYGGWTDLVISRTIEIVLCFPSFLLILLVASASDPDVVPPLAGIVLVIALVGWTGVARLARAEFLKLREREFVVAARALGFSDARTILRHVLPNALGPVLVAASFAVASGVLVESALSYLGFGIATPIPSWGSLINESRNAEHWWIHLFPGLAIFATVVGYNLVGEALRDALDPRTVEGVR